MSDGAEELPAPADDSAGDVEQTNEQIWNEIVAEKEGSQVAEEVEDLEAEDAPEPEAQSDEDPSDDDTAASEPDEGADAPEAEDEKDEEDPADKIKRLEHALNSEKGRTAALQRKIERTRKNAGTGDNPSQAEDDRLKEVADEYSDILDPVMERVQELSQNFQSERDLRQQDDERELEEELAKQGDAFLKEHPDGFNIITEHQDTFQAWVEDQPKAIRDQFEMNREEIVNGAGAALVVSHFKKSLAEASTPDPEPDPNPETQRLDKKRRRQISGARSTSARGPQSTPSDEPAADAPSSDHFAHFAKKKGLDR